MLASYAPMVRVWKPKPIGKGTLTAPWNLRAADATSADAIVPKSATTMTAVGLHRLPRIWHRGRKAAVDGERLAVDIRRLVACEEQAHRGDLVRLAGALQGIELADLVRGAALGRTVEDRLGHAGLDQARTDRVDAHAGAGERIGRGLHQADDTRLARGVGVAARARFQPRDRCGADDRA